ncbi:MAG: alpha/beta hydrolase [Myxococcota bacterium]
MTSQIVISILVAAFLGWAAASLWFARRRRRLTDSLGDPTAFRAGSRDQASEGHTEVLSVVKEMDSQVRGRSLRARISAIRAALDDFGGGKAGDGGSLGVTVVPVSLEGFVAEWVLAPDSDPDRRFLYIHGGAFFAGSPLSHRPLTAELAKRTRASVLAIDYRLLPEHPRLRGILDCQEAYVWMLTHGPDGEGPARRVYVGGDSAGGSLTLMLIAWIRDQGLRQVDAALALSPTTDASGISPSLRDNRHTDPMLGPGLGKLMTLPRPLLLLLVVVVARMRPSNPLISPVFGDLSRLPPTLIQASESEMLFDDCRRYALRAKAAGSPVALQTWPDMVHVWQIFVDILPEAVEAFDHIAQFFAKHGAAEHTETPRRAAHG